MSSSGSALLHGLRWTIGSYAATVTLRFGTNVILARLLAPELFGIMVIVNSLKVGFELVSDMGIGQSIIHNDKGADKTFYDTAWTLQVLRGLLLALASFLLAAPLARFYDIPPLAIQVTALTMAFTGLTSTSIFLAEKQLAFARRNLFETAVDFASAVTYIGLAIISPTVWSLVIGGVLASMFRAIASYRLPHSRHKFTFVKPFAREIVSFGKWIFVASIVNFASSNFDRLFLGKEAPLAILGVYGMARAISDLPVALSDRMSHLLVFPLISSSKEAAPDVLRRELSSLRLKLLLLAALVLSLAAVAADEFIKFIYDARYHQAAWMLPILLLGVWGSILSNINEATLLGYGKPSYGALANSIKLVYLVAALPAGFYLFGIFGAVVVIATSDLFRYIPISVGQSRLSISFRLQDLAATLSLAGLFGIWMILRWWFQLGTPFGELSVDMLQ